MKANPGIKISLEARRQIYINFNPKNGSLLSELSYIEIYVVPISRKFERLRDNRKDSEILRIYNTGRYYKFISKIKDKKFTRE